MSRIETAFNAKIQTYVQTVEHLETLLDNKNDAENTSSIYLAITNTLEELRLTESNIATIASLEVEPILSDLNNRLNTISTQYSPTLERAKARLLDLETGVAESQPLPDSDEETEFQMTAPHTTFFTPMRVRRTAQNTGHSLLKPLKLSIPTFNGDHKSYPTFWRQFKTLIHQNPDLNNRQKSMYLAEALKGSARIHLENKALDGTTYERIISTLKTAYAPKLKIDYRIHDDLAKLPISKNDPNSVRCRINEIRALLDQLETPTLYNSEDPAWVKLITAKFPIEIINMLCWRSSRATSIKQLLLNIEATADSMENFSIYSTQSPFVPHYQSPTKFPTKSSSQPGSHPQTKLEWPCVFCDLKRHRSAKCTTITTPQQRRDIIKQKNRCWICFSPSHTSIQCTYEKCRTCQQNHHSSLCLPNSSNTNRSFPKPKPLAGVNCTITHTPPQSFPTPAYLMTSKVSIRNPRTGHYSTRIIFLDPGATQSFIYEPIAKECQLKVLNSHSITTSGFSDSCEAFDTKSVEASFRTPFGKDMALTLLTSPKPLTGKLKSCRLSLKDKEVLEQANITITNQLVDGELFTPDILLGMDWCDTIIHDTKPTILPSGLKVRNTKLGPCIYGKALDKDNLITVNTLIVNPIIPEDMMIKQLFEIDTLGISPHEGALNKPELFYNEYSSLLKFGDGCITAPLPLKKNAGKIQNNRVLALATLHRLQKSLGKDPVQQLRYTEMISKYEQDGVIEHVPPRHEATLVYYMPHRGVWNPQKKKPLRIVFNASAKQKGQLSLNDVTSTGESFTNKIIEVLIGIRTKKFFLMCDIEGAFTQIRIAEDCKDLCRFLWLKDVTKGAVPDNIVEYRFNRLAFGITASPSVLNMSLHTFLKTQDSPLVDRTLRYLYVDNIFYTTNNSAELGTLHTKSKEMFSKISMNVREYFSNYTRFNDELPAEDQHLEKNPKILGVHYNGSTDSFILNFQMRIQQSFTKRDLLSSLHSIYDPIGLAAPLLLPFKLLLRQVMNGAIDWKEQVPRDVVDNWNTTADQIKVAKLQIPRAIPPVNEHGQLWIFVDASITAIAASAYFVNESAVSSLIMGKTKLAPKSRTLTIPRLEMAAILMGMKVAETVCAQLQEGRLSLHIASDSQIALSWLHTKKNVPVFVSNLRQNIEQIVRKAENQGASVNFHYVDTNNNPADLGTRGTTDIQKVQEKWLFAPKWLLKPDNRPVQEFKAPAEDEDMPMIILPTITEKEQQRFLVDPAKYSSYFKTKNIVGLVLKAAGLFMAIIKKTPSSVWLSPSAAERAQIIEGNKMAESILIRDAQTQLTDDYKKLFRLTKDDSGLFRIQTRLLQSSLPQGTKYPYLLPKKCDLGKAILGFLHVSNAHAGVSHMLSLFLKNFYMASARQVCKAIIKRCVPCQRLASKHFSTEYFAPIPEDRVTKAMPFRHTGLDCIGPIKYRKNEQIYIVIFTCLAIRAVHLEPIRDMSSATFFNAFIRFVARRGLPHLLRSDNGSNFMHSAKILAMLESYNSEHNASFTNYVKNQNITWIFNTPSAPWTGGVWERLVAITKTALYKSLSLKLVNEDQLYTAIIKIEGIVNSRPITYTDSVNFHENPLTPADFLTQGSPVLVPGDSVEGLGDTLDQPRAIESNREAFVNLQKIEIIAEAFWSRWSKEYLLSLRHAHASRKTRGRKHDHPEISEVVLVEDDSVSRNNWIMARVVALQPSSDNIVRTVTIRLGNGKELKKPVEKLYPLELHDEFKREQKNTASVNNITSHPTKKWGPPSVENILKFLILFQILTVSFATKLFNCNPFEVHFHPLPTNTTVCMNKHCHAISAGSSETFQLAVSVVPHVTIISRSSDKVNQTAECSHPHPCDFPPPRLLHIIGNPHCSPKLTIGLMIFISIAIFAAILSILRWIKTMTRNRATNERTISYIPSVLFTLIALITLASACNEAHVHKNIEFICDEAQNCTRIVNEDIFFNPLKRSLCSRIKFENETIGKLEIMLLHNVFTCKQRTQGYTRISKLAIHSSHRCAGTPNCPFGTGCDDIKKQTFIPELAQAYENPGETYCTRAGGGLLNNCGLPVEGCILFRPTYQPESETIYQELVCDEWEQTVEIRITLNYLDNVHIQTQQLQPYRTYEFFGVSLQVSSISEKIRPYLTNTVFLVSSENDYMLPTHKQPAVICGQAHEAEFRFSGCHVRKPCSCLGAAAQLSCNCESATNKELQRYKLPMIRPNYRVTETDGKIMTESQMEETIITIGTPHFSIENLYVNQHPCVSDYQMIRGCYNCREGMELQITCETKDELYAVIDCESFSRRIACSSKNPLTSITVHYDKPHVNENCTIICGRAEKQVIRLSANLHYVADTPIIPGSSIVDHQSTSGATWSMPHMGPFWNMILDNWTWIVPTGLTITAVTYGIVSVTPYLITILLPIGSSCCLKRQTNIPAAAVSGNP